MNEVLYADDLAQWSEAVEDLQHGQGLAAVLTVTDPDTVEKAIDFSRESRRQVEMLQSFGLPPEFS
jgi:hypothetical protein